MSVREVGWSLPVLLWAILSMTGCQTGQTHMHRLIPRETAGWRAGDEDRWYDRETIFDYINGSGEVYLSDGFRRVLVRRLVRAGEPSIEVAVFDMGSPEDAFGIFSFEQEDANLNIGEGSEYAAGLLRFWKGSLFVCVSVERETPSAQRAAVALAEEIAAGIEAAGTKPLLVNLLPEANLVANSARYFHQHSSLNYHYFLADRNILNLSERTQAVIAQYRLAEGKSHLLLVAYPDAEKAKAALDSFLASYLPEGKATGIAQTEDGGWTAAKLYERLVMVVLDAPSRGDAEALIQAVERKAEAESS